MRLHDALGKREPQAVSACGARPGLVGAEEALSQWGFSLQEEKEAVMILAKAESKLAIMQAICDNCGLQSEAQGIVLSLPVDNVVGLE